MAAKLKMLLLKTAASLAQGRTSPDDTVAVASVENVSKRKTIPFRQPKSKAHSCRPFEFQKKLMNMNLAWKSETRLSLVALRSELVWKNVGELDAQFAGHRSEFVQGQMMLPFFDSKQGHGGKPGLFGKLRVGQFAPLFPQKCGELRVKAFSHPKTVANELYRM